MSPPEKRRPAASSSSLGPTSASRPPSSSNIAQPPPAQRSRSKSPAPPSASYGTLSSSVGSASPPHSATAKLAASCAILHQRDLLRIHALERATNTMESEFSELENESAHWQAKCLMLEKQLAQRKQEHEDLRQAWESVRVELLQAKGEILNCEEEISRRDDKVLQAREEILRRDKEILRRDQEIRELKGQVRGLKEWVSNSTRSDGEAQTSDEVFGDGMTKLGNGLQNWVLVNFRRSKIDLSNISEAMISELNHLVPMYEELIATSKIHLLQSVVSRLLVESVFNTYFAGLPTEDARQLTDAETVLASYGAPPAPISQWRSTSLTILRKDGNEKLQRATAKLADSIVSRVNELLDAITATNSNESRDQGLRALVNSAIDLSRLLSVQKASFNVIMPEILPHQRIIFDAETMEDIGGEDEENLFGSQVCCITFPGIIKRGSGSEGHVRYCNVISKARVLCSLE